MTRDEFKELLDAHGIVFVGDAAYRVAQLVAAAEREACAEVVEKMPDMIDGWRAVLPSDCAAAIRARSKT